MQSEGSLYFPITNKCYQLVDYPKADANVSYICPSINQSFIATSVNSKAELNIVKYLMDINSNCFSDNNIWLGLEYNANLGNWQWADGNPLNVTNWKAGYPKNATEYGSCAGIANRNCQFYGGCTDQWTNLDCQIKAKSLSALICEAPPILGYGDDGFVSEGNC